MTTGSSATDRMDESRWCVGMALDTAGGWIYWTQKGGDNAGVGSIRRAHIQMPAGQTSTNRTDIEILFSGLPEPIDIDLDLEARDHLLGRPRRRHDQPRAHRDPVGQHGRQPHRPADPGHRQVAEAIGVAIDKRRGRLYYTAANGQLGRANLDGTNKKELADSAR